MAVVMTLLGHQLLRLFTPVCQSDYTNCAVEFNEAGILIKSLKCRQNLKQVEDANDALWVKRHDHNPKIADRSSENAAKFKYLGTIVKDQNLISRLNSGNACYHSVQNLLFSHLLV
jgi:hypothetical protein